MDTITTKYIDCQYFPNIYWFKNLINDSNKTISSCIGWKKMSFHNRCVIAGGSGLINLSVPIENGRNQKAVLKDIKISYSQNWQKQHWRTILSCYNRSPFFEFYADKIEKLLTNKWIYLFDLNLEIINTLVPYLFDKQYIVKVDNSDIANSDLSRIIADEPTPKNFQQFAGEVIYHQIFEDRIGFQPNLSILDLLFMEGPNSKQMLIQ